MSDNGRWEHFQQVLSMILDEHHRQPFDAVLITRFDLRFNKSLDEVAISNQHLNLVSEMHYPGVVCDNFYLVPGKIIFETRRLTWNLI